MRLVAATKGYRVDRFASPVLVSLCSVICGRDSGNKIDWISHRETRIRGASLLS